MDMPHWVSSLEKEHWLRASLYTTIQQAAGKITRIREIESVVKRGDHLRIRGLCKDLHGGFRDRACAHHGGIAGESVL